MKTILVIIVVLVVAYSYDSSSLSPWKHTVDNVGHDIASVVKQVGEDLNKETR